MYSRLKCEHDLPGMINCMPFGLNAVESIRVTDYSPDIVARHMCIIDSELFAKITDEELLAVSWTKPNKKTTAPNINNATIQFNNISFLVLSEILHEKSPKSRVVLIKFFIKVLKELYELNNLNSMKSIICALECYHIYRLKKTFSLLSKEKKQLFLKFKDLLSEENNRALLRAHLNACHLPCIPFLGLYLADLTYLDSVYGCNIGSNSDRRKSRMYEIINTIRKFQNSKYEILPVDQTLLEFLKRERYVESANKLMDDQFYRRSILLEPPISPQPKNYNTDNMNNQADFDSDINSSPRLSVFSIISPNKSPITCDHLKVKSPRILNIEDINSDRTVYETQTLTCKRPKYLKKCQIDDNITYEGFLKVRIQSNTEHGFICSEKKAWVILTTNKRLLHYNLKTNLLFPSMFGTQQNVPYYIIDNLTDFYIATVNFDKKEFVLVSENKSSIVTYTAKFSQDIIVWISYLKYILESIKDEQKNS